MLGILLVQALRSFAIVRYFRRRSGQRHAWRTLIAPIAGGALMLFSAYLLLDNRAALAAPRACRSCEAIPWIVAAVFVLGAIGLRPWNARVPQSVPIYES